MPNIAVVVLDTVRKDYFDEHFDWLPGHRFENAWSTSHWTVPSHASLFTGKYPSEVGIHSKSPQFESEEDLLPELLQQKGYRARAFCANAMLYTTGFDRLFDEFEIGGPALKAHKNVFDWGEALDKFSSTGPLRYPLSVINCLVDSSDTVRSLETGWWLKMKEHDGAPTALKQIKSWEFSRDEFLFVNLMEAHAGYSAPKEYRTIEPEYIEFDSILEGEGDLSALEQAYEDEVRYLSDIYRDIFEELQRDFDYIITLSDHGELFGEYDARGHYYGVYPELTHVPIVLYDGDAGGESDGVVSILDLAQTIANIADLKFESRGLDLREPIPDRTCITEFHGFREGRIDHLREEGFTKEEISKYDRPLKGIAAPDSYYGYETIDGFRENRTAVGVDPETVLEETKEELESVSVRDSTSLNVSEGVKKSLQDLGYM